MYNRYVSAGGKDEEVYARVDARAHPAPQIPIPTERREEIKEKANPNKMQISSFLKGLKFNLDTGDILLLLIILFLSLESDDDEIVILLALLLLMGR